MLRVAVVGGGPSGSCAAEVLAKAGIETWLFERKLDNAKPCGGAIPLCMVEEFDLPESIIDRKVRNMRMISPSNREVDIHLENSNEYIGMCRREVLDGFLRNRAAELGAHLVNGLVQSIDTGSQRQGPYTLHYADYSSGGPTGELKTLEVDLIVGADGANSRVAKAMMWLTRGYNQTAAEVIGDALFEENHENMVMVRDIEMYSMCEHHMLPFFGKVHIAYIPNGKIVGLSKLLWLSVIRSRRLRWLREPVAI